VRLLFAPNGIGRDVQPGAVKADILTLQRRDAPAVIDLVTSPLKSVEVNGSSAGIPWAGWATTAMTTSPSQLSSGDIATPGNVHRSRDWFAKFSDNVRETISVMSVNINGFEAL